METGWEPFEYYETNNNQNLIEQFRGEDLDSAKVEIGAELDAIKQLDASWIFISSDTRWVTIKTKASATDSYSLICKESVASEANRQEIIVKLEWIDKGQYC